MGQVLNVNRIRDASGQPKGFGFVDYGDAESVLRAIAVIHGANVVGRDGEQKSLVVKADAKVRARLDAHEAGRASTSQLESQMAFAKDSLQEVLERIRKASHASGQEEGEELNPDGTKKYRIPAHLQDLAPDDLPEESRGLITREIAFFRERAMKREEANKLAEEKRNMARRQAEDSRRFVGDRSQGPPPHNGPPARDSPRPDQGGSRQWGRPDQGPPSQPRGYQGSPPPVGPSSDRDGRVYRPDHHQRPHDDRLDYDRPVGFVPSSSNRPSGYGQSNGLSDEDVERTRLRRIQEQNEQQYHQRLSRWQVRERGRTQALDRERQQKYYEQQDSDKRRQSNLEQCSKFDDDEEAEYGNEPFIVDRGRWRKQRQQARRRELEQDAQDARREAEEAAALQKESEEFLARQASMLSSMSDSAALDPTATSGEPPKLKLLAVPAVDKKPEDAAKAKPKAAAAFAAADAEDEAAGKKKRELIPLNYSDDEDDEDKIEKKRKKVKELVSAIPTDKAGLWRYDVKWEELNEVSHSQSSSRWDRKLTRKPIDAAHGPGKDSPIRGEEIC